MKKYVSKFKESVSGTMNVLDADCEYLPKIKSIILKEYKKISGKDAFILTPWSSIRNRYNLLPEDHINQNEIMSKAFGKSKASIIWDTVDVSFSFARMELYLQFKGYKLDKNVNVRI